MIIRLYAYQSEFQKARSMVTIFSTISSVLIDLYLCNDNISASLSEWNEVLSSQDATLQCHCGAFTKTEIQNDDAEMLFPKVE